MAPPPTPRIDEPSSASFLNWMKEYRGRLILLALAILAFRSGVNPPGGYWRADEAGHVAGEPVLRDRCEHCYAYFRKANDMSFFTSIILILLLSSQTFYGTPPKMAALLLIFIFDLACFVAAYAFGTIIPNLAATK